MLVISRDLVLYPPAGELPNAPLFGWRNRVNVANLSADTAHADHPALNLANPATRLYWQAADTAEQYLTIETGSADDFDYLAFARHNLGSAGITVSVEGDDGDGFDEIVQETVLPDDAPALLRFPAAAYAFLRLRLQSGDAPARIAVLYAGKLLVMPRKIYVGHTPLPFGRRIEVVNGLSQSGEYTGTIETGAKLSTDIRLSNIDPAFYRSDIDPFLAGRAPFFFAWRPQTYPREVGYCWLRSDPQVANQRRNGMMSVALDIEGLA